MLDLWGRAVPPGGAGSQAGWVGACFGVVGSRIWASAWGRALSYSFKPESPPLGGWFPGGPPAQRLQEHAGQGVPLPGVYI